jgi:hypothetical protein
MTILGIGLIICGLTLICASAVFPWIVGRKPPSQESFEESRKRHDHYGVRRAPRDLDADKSEPMFHIALRGKLMVATGQQPSQGFSWASFKGRELQRAQSISFRPKK